MKYLFLDVDGVLNHEQWYESQHNNPDAKPFPYSCFDPACIKRVNEILDKTGAELVISSSWRLDKCLAITLNSVGLNRSFGVTPSWRNNGCENFTCRGQEIQAYLKTHIYNPKTDRYAILDDDTDMLPDQQEQFFQTACECLMSNCDLVKKNGGTGLTDTVRDAVIEYLNSGVRH